MRANRSRRRSRDPPLEVTEVVGELLRLLVGQRGQRVEGAGRGDGVQLGHEVLVVLRREVGRGEPAGAGAANPVAEDLGKLLDEAGEIARRAALRPSPELGGDDVEPALHEPPQVGDLVLHPPALVTHRPDVGQRRRRQVVPLATGQHGVDLVTPHAPRLQGRSARPDAASSSETVRGSAAAVGVVAIDDAALHRRRRHGPEDAAVGALRRVVAHDDDAVGATPTPPA